MKSRKRKATADDYAMFTYEWINHIAGEEGYKAYCSLLERKINYEQFDEYLNMAIDRKERREKLNHGSNH
jgi:hypothetical protein